MLAYVGFKNIQMLVDQFSGTERHLVREADTAAVLLDSLPLQYDLPCDVAFLVLVVLALDVDRGLQLRDGIYTIRGIVDHNPVHELQGSEHFGTGFAVEHGPARALVDEGIRSHRDDQAVTQQAGRLQVANVAEVEKVECAMALDNPFTGAAELLRDNCHLVEAADLPAGPPVPEVQRVIGDR